MSLLCWSQCPEKKLEGSGPEPEPCPELHIGPVESLARVSTAGSEGGHSEQPFIVLSQEEYGEHHSSIMHCRWARELGTGILDSV